MKGSTALSERVATLIPRMTPAVTADALVCGYGPCSADFVCYFCCFPTRCIVEFCSYCIS